METTAHPAALPAPPRAIGPFVLWRVFFRSLFIQACFNPRAMQALGFTYAVYPALERLYRDPARLERAAKRHLCCCFNSHPYAAAAILGGALYHEERVARGEEPPEAVNEFKLALMGPLAALGDGFFWLSLRPAMGALGALLALTTGLWGALAYLLLYNAVHLGLRARFLFKGHRLGDGVIEILAASRLPWHGERLRWLAAACASATAAVAALGAGPAFPQALAAPAGPWGWLAAAWALFGTSHLLLGRGVSPYAAVYGAATVALISGWIF